MVENPNNQEESITSVPVSEYVGKQLSVESLAGRNFYLYTKGIKNKDQPHVFNVPDLALDLDEDSEEESDNELSYYLTDKCWVKRISAVEDGREAYYLFEITLNADDKIATHSVILEEVSRVGGGWFMLPGMEMQGYSSYQFLDDYPEEVLHEFDLLIRNRALSENMTFIGKRLPQKMIDAGGNGGSTTEYTYALQSAYRLAYMHMTVETDEDGIIEDFIYSTYQSTGSGYWDLFSRPTSYSDREDEAKDMLLYILDQYTDKEYDSFR